MKQTMRLVFVSLLIIMVYGMNSLAQDCSFPFAALVGDRLVYCDGAETREVAVTSGFTTWLVWNATGDQLAFISDDAVQVFNTTTGETVRLDTPLLNLGYPIGWTGDGRILMTTETPQEIFFEPFPFDVLAVEPVAGAPAQMLGEIQLDGGCGGAYFDPADFIYSQEAYASSRFFPVLAATPAGIVHSAHLCGLGARLLNPATGEVVSLGDDLDRFRVSPDGNLGAALTVSDIDLSVTGLVVYDLATLQATPVAVSGTPDQIAWGADSASLYYSERVPQADLRLTREQTEALADFFFVDDDEQTYPTYAVRIHRVDLATGAETLLYSGSGYAVGRMTEQDGALIFSLIPNLDVLPEALDAGVRDMSAFYDRLTPRVLRLPLPAGGDAQEIGTYRLFTPAP